MKLTPDHVRHALITAQGLTERPKKPTRAHVLETIRRMGVLQIDTIHVVARSPYLVLWSRLGEYDPLWLDDLLAKTQIFEYWSHEASFLPIESYPAHRRMMIDGVRRWSRLEEWVASNQSAVEMVLAHLRERGEAKAADFERADGKKGSWWDWKAEKMALEMLFMRGDVMIARRENFHRVYALRERVLPDWDDAEAPTLDEAMRQFVLESVRGLGVTPAAWVADYFRLKKDRVSVLEQLADLGLLVRAEVDGWEAPAYIHPDNLRMVEAVQAGEIRHRGAVLLSPFDPIVWDRKRALALFDFDYKIECYTPAPKRKYGYFTLPILWRGQLIGRLDPKAHRKEGIFEVKALHFEPGVKLTNPLLTDVAAAIQRCAQWHKTPTVAISMTDPPEALPRLLEMMT